MLEFQFTENSVFQEGKSQTKMQPSSWNGMAVMVLRHYFTVILFQSLERLVKQA